MEYKADSASLESLAVLADRVIASETDVEEVKQGVAGLQVSESVKRKLSWTVGRPVSQD